MFSDFRDRLRAWLHAHAKRMMIDEGAPAAIRRPMRWMIVSFLATMAGVVVLAALASIGGSREVLVTAIAGLLALGAGGALLANAAVARALHRAHAARYRLCPGCTYDLRDLGQRGTCPECGRHFERYAVRKRWLEAERRLKRTPRA